MLKYAYNRNIGKLALWTCYKIDFAQYSG